MNNSKKPETDNRIDELKKELDRLLQEEASAEFDKKLTKADKKWLKALNIKV